MKTTADKRRILTALMISLFCEFIITLLTVSAYEHLNLTNIQKQVLQCSVYLLLIAVALVMVKFSGHTLTEIGLFKRKLGLQIFIGLLIAGVFILVLFTAGWRPHMPTAYLTFSFLLVGFSEELFSRGLILRLARDLSTSDNWAILIQAVIFGLLHFPIHRSLGQVMGTFLVALIFGAIRVEFSNTLGIPTFAVTHWLYDLLL